MKKMIFPKINLENVKGVLIDLDNTLYSFDFADQCALQKVYNLVSHTLNLSFDSFLASYKEQWKNLFNNLGPVPSAHCRHTMFQNMLEKMCISKPFLLAQKMEKVYFKTLLTSMTANKEALSFLKECKKKNIPVCLVTDLYGSIQVQKLKKLKLSQYVDFVVANDEVGIDKPHPKIFQKAMSKINTLPQETIMIGDNFEKDIKGAQQLGIKTYQVIFDK